MIWRYEAVLPLSLPHDLLNIYYVTHRIFQRGFSTKGDEPAKTEFSLLALPKQFSKFEGAKRYFTRDFIVGIELQNFTYFAV